MAGEMFHYHSRKERSLNRWEIYELLKGNKNYKLEQLNNTNKTEIIKGIEEYIYSKNRGDNK